MERASYGKRDMADRCSTYYRRKWTPCFHERLSKEQAGPGHGCSLVPAKSSTLETLLQVMSAFSRF